LLERSCLKIRASLAEVFLVPSRQSNVRTQRRRGLQERRRAESDAFGNSHSGALGSRVDRATALVSEAASSLSSGSLVSAASASLVVLLAGSLTLLVLLSDGLGVLLVLVHSPVEDVVVLEALTDEEITEDLAEVGVVGLVVEAERAGVVEVDGELVGEATAEDLGGSGHLLLHDAVVLLLLSGRLETLPREAATAEVEHDVAEGLHVITTRLLCEVLVCVGNREA
jgi:hypothetical protein